MEESIGGGRLTVECHRDPNISKASRSNPSLNGHLHDPDDIDRTLNEVDVDKVLQYRVDYNNRPSYTITFMPAIDSTSGRLRPIPSRSHTHPSHTQNSRLLTSSLSLGVPVPCVTQCV